MSTLFSFVEISQKQRLNIFQKQFIPNIRKLLHFGQLIENELHQEVEEKNAFPVENKSNGNFSDC